MGKKQEKKIKDVKPFIPMPLNWPGRISNPDLFAEFATKCHHLPSNKNPSVRFQITQNQFEFSQMAISLPKSSSIFRLQCEIAKLLHVGSVDPSKILIYRKEIIVPVAGQQLADDEPKVNLIACRDFSILLADFFPEVQDSTSALGDPGIDMRLGESSVTYPSGTVVKHMQVPTLALPVPVIYDISPILENTEAYYSECGELASGSGGILNPNIGLVPEKLKFRCGIICREPDGKSNVLPVAPAAAPMLGTAIANTKKSNKLKSTARKFINIGSMFKPTPKVDAHISRGLNATLTGIKSNIQATIAEATKL